MTVFFDAIRARSPLPNVKYVPPRPVSQCCTTFVRLMQTISQLNNTVTKELFEFNNGGKANYAEEKTATVSLHSAVCLFE